MIVLTIKIIMIKIVKRQANGPQMHVSNASQLLPAIIQHVFPPRDRYVQL